MEINTLPSLKKCSKAIEKTKEYVAYIFTQTGKHIKAFHCDNAKEYISKDVCDYLSSNSIQLKLTAPYSPEQNGVVEHLNHTLIEHARAMLAAYNLPLFLWPEAVAYATYLKNQSPTCALSTAITPDKVQTLCNVTFIDGNIDSSEIPLSMPQLEGEIDYTADLLEKQGQIEPEAMPDPPTTQAPASNFSMPSTLTPILSQRPPASLPPAKAPRNISSAISQDNIILSPCTCKYAKPNSVLVGYALPALSDPISNNLLTVEDTKSCPDWTKWKQAMDEEMAQL
jgi:hypothetical protein